MYFYDYLLGDVMKIAIYLFFILITISITYGQDETENADPNTIKKQTPAKDFYSQEIVFEQDTLYHIEMHNGAFYIGTIISENDNELKILSNEIGEITLSKKYIVSIRKIYGENVKDGKYWFPNPSSTRNLLSPTGYGLKAGEGYYQNIYVFFNSITFGITDFISLGVGTEFFTLSSGRPIFIVNPKLSFELSESFRLGISSFLIGANFDRDYSVAGIHNAVLTYGNEDDNISVGGGLTTSENNSADAIFTLSGMVRLSKGTALVTENWIGSTAFEDLAYSTIFSYAIRLMGETYSFDLGFINNSDINDYLFFGIPYVDFILRW